MVGQDLMLTPNTGLLDRAYVMCVAHRFGCGGSPPRDRFRNEIEAVLAQLQNHSERLGSCSMFRIWKIPAAGQACGP